MFELDHTSADQLPNGPGGHGAPHLSLRAEFQSGVKSLDTLIEALTALLLWRVRVNSAWLILGGAVGLAADLINVIPS